MLVELAKSRSHHTLAECVACSEITGHKYIGVASHMLASGAAPNLCRADGEPAFARQTLLPPTAA